MHILLVEDDLSIADSLREGLIRYGFDVDHVTTGSAALAAGSADVMLLDLGLPDMDGLDVCRRLRARSAVPIIVITARGDEVDTQRWLALKSAVDTAARRVFCKGEEVPLAPKEFDLLSTLAERPGTVLTRESLIDTVWDTHWFGSTRTLDVHIAALRQKLAGALTITAVRGVGFRLDRD
ncbi:response regulator transcription factor [Arthrobacter sp. ISL-30]|uniref:response regulator transcription factor n=1 Tax=Arthrobacter sp. ISL-30 TaxID=2819109 RepID=UPI001BE57207|nr:response regulator transcription factor [Arthrobacter sp. ISL-30]MBT2512992.1 response regulator transcription factor [Arthrobacter sp. ISL-30]